MKQLLIVNTQERSYKVSREIQSLPQQMTNHDLLVLIIVLIVYYSVCFIQRKSLILDRR